MKLQDILNIVDIDVFNGNINQEIKGLNLCNRETKKDSILSYAVNDKYTEQVKMNAAIKAIIVPLGSKCYDDIMLSRDGCIVYAKAPEELFYRIHEQLCKGNVFYERYDFPKKIGENCKIHPTAFIDDGVIIGNNVTIGAHSTVNAGSIIDDEVIIGCNSVIGSEGFQLIVTEGGESMHITHVGRTHICSNVYVGDCTCIANGLFEGESYIGRGAKIDNLVHVAHNIYVGENAVLTAGVILCGSSVIESGAWIAPNSSVLNRVVVGENAKIGLGSVVTRNIPAGKLAYGVPAKINNLSKS